MLFFMNLWFESYVYILGSKITSTFGLNNFSYKNSPKRVLQQLTLCTKRPSII